MNARYLYVIHFGNGIVKVGQTKNIRKRYKAHKAWARQADTDIAEVDFGLRYGSARPDERKLIAFCQARWSTLPGHREYFIGADFDEVYAYFWSLEEIAASAGYVVDETA